MRFSAKLNRQFLVFRIISGYAGITDGSPDLRKDEHHETLSEPPQ